MKITKEELKKIIEEELEQVAEAGPQDLKKVKREMQNMQGVISDMTMMLDKLYKFYSPTDEKATLHMDLGQHKKDYAKAVKCFSAIKSFKDSLKRVKESAEEDKQQTEGMDKQQAGELIKQLGGNRFIAMTGAKDFAVGPKGAIFKIGRNAKSISHVRIDLENDLYNVEFIRVRGTKIKVVKYFKHIYFDQLRDLFEKNTGLRTSL